MPKSTIRPVYVPAAAMDEFRRPMMQRIPSGVRFLEGIPDPAGAGGPAGDPPGDTTGDPAAGGPSGDPDDQAKSELKFSQADLDTIIGKRLAKFSDYDQLKTERDQLKAAAGQAPDVEQALATQKAELEASHATALLKAISRGIAAELGFHNPVEASLYLDAQTLTEGNALDEKKVEEALKQALVDRPYLAKTAGFDTGLGRRGGDPAVKPGVDRLTAAFDASLSD